MANVNLNKEESKSQKKQILAYLQKGKSLTQMEALNLFGCFRLASRICELREEGVNIKTERRVVPSGKTVASYYIQN